MRDEPIWRRYLRWWGPDVERDVDEELEFHLAMLIEEFVREGYSPEEAHARALARFGDSRRARTECVEIGHDRLQQARRTEWWSAVWRDLRYALRGLRRSPGFAVVAILTLALGLAASLAIFGFVDAALIRPLPYQDPSRLVTVFGTRPDLAQGQTRGMVSYMDFVDWRTRNQAFNSIAAYDVREGFIWTTPTGPQRVSGLRVTSGFFRTLGVTPVLGREFNPDEEGPSAPATVVLSYAAWQTRFGGSPNVLGRTVMLQAPWASESEPHVVIGVLPKDFHFPMAEHADFWTTIRGLGCWSDRSCQSMQTVARLAPGISLELASASVTSMLEQLRSEYPDLHPDPMIAKLVPLREVMLGDVRPILLMLLSGAGLLLVIAGINVVSLLLARADRRTREIAVRHALGASSARLVLQFAAEALLLVAVGSVFGLILAAWGMQLLTSLLSAEMLSRMPYLQGTGLNLRLVAFACVVSLVVTVVFALTPVVRMSISGKLAGLKEASRGSAGTSWRRFGAHLVVVELAMAVILLVSAGLLGKSLYRFLHVDTGFNMQQLATLSVSPVSVEPGSGEAGPGNAGREQAGALARRVADRVAALPGVEAVGYADLLPLSVGLDPSSTFWIPGRSDQDQLRENWPVRRVSAGYFTVLQSRLLRGRQFTDEEIAATRPVMIINETAARRYFPDEDPIGQSIALGGAASPAREIVGVVADIQDGPPETPAHPAAYVPFDQVAFDLVVRTSPPEHKLFMSLVAAIHEIQPDLLVYGVTTMTERMNRMPSTALHRSSAWLVGGFAAVAFFLSVVGLYGVVAYSVGQRTREIGVRMAIGAQRRSVYRLVLGEATWLVGAGSALGVICAVVAATLMRHLLYGVQSWDPSTLATAVGVLIVSALLASYIPARRAASVDPIEVLRAE